MTPTIKKLGLRAGPIARRLLRHERTKRWMRTAYSLQSMWKLRQANRHGASFKDVFQAGKSVEGVTEVKSVAEVLQAYAAVM